MNHKVIQLSSKARNLALDTGLGIADALSNVLDEHVEQLREIDFDEQELQQELIQKLSGFSFLQPLLDDEAVEEIWINKPGEVRFARNGVHQVTDVSFSGQELQTLVERMIRQTGRRLDRSMPFIDAELGSGYRLHAVIPDITRKHMSLNIRKFSNRVLTAETLLAGGVLSEPQLKYLLDRLSAGANLMISGATQAGKTTLLSALLSALKPEERVVSVEDTFELRCLLPDWVALQTRPPSTDGRLEVDLRRLVRETLRMRPTRLVVGEVRGAEALDMLIAMNSGIPGMCTIHANSADEALNKLKTLPLLAGGNISSVFLDSVIRGSLDLFVHCQRNTDGSRKLASIKTISANAALQLEEVLL